MKKFLAAMASFAALAGAAPAVSAPTQPCASPSSTAAVCVLRSVPSPLTGVVAPSVSTIGLDGWGPPPVSVLRANGYKFGAAYLSYTPSKNWTLAAVRAYRKAGLGVVMVWETSQFRAESGEAGGVADAREAARQAAALGNVAGPIDFAVDFDATCSEITDYFRGVHLVLGARDNAYGGETSVSCVHGQHLVGGQNWMTYAWQAGRPWLSASVAPLEQFLNGNTYDLDRAIAPRYGQVFVSVVNPTSVLDRTRRHILVRAFSPVWGAPRLVVASEFNTVNTWDKFGCKRPVHRWVCVTSLDHAKALESRVVFVAHHKGRNLRLFAHPPRWGVNRLGRRHLILHGITGV